MELAKYIEHTQLLPTATTADIKTLCHEAINYHFYGVCIPECYVSLARNILKDESVKIIAVVGFPLGNQSTVAKVCEAKHAILLGADEIDMVINLGYFKSGQHEKVINDIAAVKKAIGKHPLKVILETCYLTKEEIKTACMLAIKAKADLVKTSTGFGSGGATIEDIEIMKTACRGILKIKASGGIKDRATAMEYITAGADRIGTSSGVHLVL